MILPAWSEEKRRKVRSCSQCVLTGELRCSGKFAGSGDRSPRGIGHLGKVRQLGRRVTTVVRFFSGRAHRRGCFRSYTSFVLLVMYLYRYLPTYNKVAYFLSSIFFCGPSRGKIECPWVCYTVGILDGCRIRYILVRCSRGFV